MSSLWTPGGERPVPPRQAGGADAEAGAPPATDGGGSSGGRGGPRLAEATGTNPELEQAEADLEAVRQQLLEAPVETVLLNHCYGIFELAALHMSQRPPSLNEARLAVDALGALVEGLAGRLGPDESNLAEGLAQLRLAWVRLAGPGGDPPVPPDGQPG